MLATAQLAIQAHAAEAPPVAIVRSAAPDDIAVTIYRDDFALVTERRVVDLPGGAVKLEFEGVLDTALPQSAVLTGLGGEEQERNFDFDALTASSLLLRSVGETVTRITTAAQKGREPGEVSEPAVLAAAGDGVVLRFADRVEALGCDGAPQRLVFARLPQNLRARPTLSTLLESDAPAGRRVLILSYLAGAMSWKADYVVNLDEKDETATIQAWISLENRNREGFKAATLGLAAGELSRVIGIEAPRAAPENARRACWPQGSTATGIPARYYDRTPPPDAVVVTGFRAAAVAQFSLEAAAPPPPPPPAVAEAKLATREEVGDFQLYHLPEKTALNAQSRKQAALLAKPRAAYQRLHRFRIDSFALDGSEFAPDQEGTGPHAAEIILRFFNAPKDGLGDPLPEGVARVFAPGASGRTHFAGHDQVRDIPVGVKWEIAMGASTAVAMQARLVEETRQPLPDTRMRTSRVVELKLTNANRKPVIAELRQAPAFFAFRLLEPDAGNWVREDGDWTQKVQLAPNSEKRVRFSYSFEDEAQAN